MRRGLCQAWRIPAAALLAGGMLSGLAQTNAERVLEDQVIPPLHPPHGEMAPGFWEQHWWGVALVLVAGAVATGLVWRRLSQPEAVAVPPPHELARKTLEALKGQPENSHTLSELVRVIRRYFVDTFSLTQTEMTNRQLGELLRKHEQVEGEVAAVAIRFLETCERRQFDTRQPSQSHDLIDEALKLIDQTEATRVVARSRIPESDATS